MEAEDQWLRQRKSFVRPGTTPAERSESLDYAPSPPPRGCCHGLGVIFCFISRSQQASNKKLHPQEDGSMDHISTNHQGSLISDISPKVSTAVVSSKFHLEALRDQAVINGWYIQQHEIELHEKIGQGTTADIFKGTLRGFDVAVKWIYPEYFQSNENSEDWFAQEIDILSHQGHPFVLQFIGACISPPETAWIVTELLNGRTLTEWLYGHKKRQKERYIPLPPLEQRIKKGLEIAQAMQYLHGQKPKVLHRDLKPSNIFLDDAMHVRVSDFGHARFLLDGEQAFTGETGTYVYMAPEVIRSEPYGEKCDVYSFGVILNELVTGEHPYIETNYKAAKIALEVQAGKLRPALPRDNGKLKDLIDLICNLWDDDQTLRPSFETITAVLRNNFEKLIESSD